MEKSPHWEGGEGRGGEVAAVVVCSIPLAIYPVVLGPEGVFDGSFWDAVKLCRVGDPEGLGEVVGLRGGDNLGLG